MTHWAHVNFFPDELLDLQDEVRYHPELQMLLANHPAMEWETKVAEIAVYCSIVLNGYYTEEDLLRICKILTRRLRKMRPKETRERLVLVS